MKTKVRQHAWVKLVKCPVETLPDHEGDPYIFVDPDAQREAENNAAYGCDDCGVDMVSGFGTECPGKEAV